MSLEDYISDLPDPEPVTVWTRDQWNALPPVEPSPPLEHPIYHIIFTHTQSPACKNHEECVKVLQDLQRKHMEEGMTDILFHWMVGGGNNVYEGRGWHSTTVNTDPRHEPFQGKSLNVAFIGNYLDRFPPKEIFETTSNFLLDAYNKDIFHPDVDFILHTIVKPPKAIKQPKKAKEITQVKKTFEQLEAESLERQSKFYFQKHKEAAFEDNKEET